MRALYTIVIGMILTILLLGCTTSNEDQLIEYTIAKRIAQETLSTDERTTVLP